MGGVTLNRRVTLESPTRVADGAGGFVESWAVLGTLWARIDQRIGRFVGSPGGAVSETAVRITLRAAPVGQSNRPRPGQRLRMGPRTFLIEAVAESDAAGRYLRCNCQEEIAP